jgi:hypothetical protein
MKNQRDKLRQYQKRITVLTDREKEIAKECLAKGQADKAKLALRRKKYQESLLSKTDSQLAQLEVLTSDVEFALVQKDVLYGLQQGTAVLKEIHREMGGIENVEKLLADSEEARQYQEARTQSLNMPVLYTDIGAGSIQPPRGPHDQPRRRRSRRRARGPRGRTQRRTHRTRTHRTRTHTTRPTKYATATYSRGESAEGEGESRETSAGAGC